MMRSFKRNLLAFIVGVTVSLCGFIIYSGGTDKFTPANIVKNIHSISNIKSYSLLVNIPDVRGDKSDAIATNFNNVKDAGDEVKHVDIRAKVNNSDKNNTISKKSTIGKVPIDALEARDINNVSQVRRNEADMFGNMVSLQKLVSEIPVVDVTSTDFLKMDVDMEALIQRAKANRNCSQFFQNPNSVWKSDRNNTFTAREDLLRMTQALKCGILDEEFLKTPPHKSLYQFEEKLFSREPCRNKSTLTSLKNTLVTFVGDSASVKVGDEVRIRIQTVDELGQPKTIGGDEVRVWLINSDSAFTAHVADLENGTYLATTRPQMRGQFVVKVAIAYTREYLNALARLLRTYKFTRLYAGNFANSKADETTPCYHTPLLPGGYTQACNLTGVNGSPWYCGKPVKSALACSDFKGSQVGPMKQLENLPTTPEEFDVLHTNYRDASGHLVQKQLKLQVVDSENHKERLICGGIEPCPKCHDIPPIDTWHERLPSGYLHEDVWYPLNCQPGYVMDDCLQNKHWVYLGDSNLRGEHYSYIRVKSKCQPILKALTAKWHKPMRCIHKKLNFTARWEPHSQPFLNGPILAEVGSLIPSSHVIDSLNNDDSYIIVFDHYYHTSAGHISSFESKMITIRDALVRFFRRNKHSIAVLHSPYITWYGWAEHFGAGDMFGRHYIRIQREIFSDLDLRERIVYLPAWDITMAVANAPLHPNRGYIIGELIRNFVCGRKL